MMVSEKKKINPFVSTVIAIILALMCALVFGEKMAIIAPIGNMFINLVKMCCVPLMMCSLISTIASMNDMRKLGRIGGKMIFVYIMTCIIAGIIGLVIGFGSNLGAGVVIEEGVEITTDSINILEVIYNVVPDNIFGAMANFDMLGCVIFSVFFGVALAAIGDSGKQVVDLIGNCTKAMYKIIEIIMHAAPIGIFALISSGVGTYGKDILATMGMLIVFEFVAAIILLTFYAVVTHFTSKVSFKVIVPSYLKVAATAFATRSSAATLPLTIETSVKDMDCDQDIANFMLPVGCSINMNGFVCSLVIIAVMAGNCYGSPLSVGQCVTAVFIATLSGIGMPGIPNGGPVFYILLFTALGLPSGALIGMIEGVGSLIDMANTTCNVCGDICATSIVTASERRRAKR